MGMEDRLCKPAMLNIVLEDTLAYSTVKEFVAGFKTVPIAFQTNASGRTQARQARPSGSIVCALDRRLLFVAPRFLYISSLH